MSEATSAAGPGAEPEGSASPLRHPVSAAALVIGGAITALVGLVVTHVASSDRAGLIAAASFGSVISAAMIISWGAEAGQFFISQGFAVGLVALLQVMPEFMVEAVIAWKGQVDFMFANATGSNRLLIGLGWPLIYFTADISHRMKRGGGAGDVRLRRENILELLSLLLASSFYLKLLFTGVLTIFDGLFLCGCYLLYMYLLAQLPEEEEETKEDLLAPARVLAEIRSPIFMRFAVFGIFIIGGLVMALVSDPFVESLKVVAAAWGIPAFSFIQWVAPFLSEFPEKVTAFYWSLTIRLAPMALLNMISSTVSQFTLLVGMIPIVYATAVFTGRVAPIEHGMFGLPVVPMHSETLRAEIFLSWAMTLLGCAQIAKMRFSRRNAVTIFVIWLAQFFTSPIEHWTGLSEHDQRGGLAVLCIVLAVIELVLSWRELELRAALRETVALIRRERRET